MHDVTIIDFKDLGERLIFRAPLCQLKTRELDQVKGILDQVTAYQAQGYYVVGYMAYEAAPAFEPLFQVVNKADADTYLAYFTVHDQVERQPFPLTAAPVDLPEDWRSVVDQANYAQAIGLIKDQLRQGNTYQVNYTLPLTAEIDQDPRAIYEVLRLEQEARYTAYIAHDDLAIVSLSPELFFDLDGRDLTTRPMKGTVARGVSADEDLARAKWLQADSKNLAENMMIVDLLRNDMNRISETGSERVTQLCQVEQYPTVWQMTSTISSRLQAGLGLTDVFSALFPCGSITGAPKIATMAVIAQVEGAPRGVYCGSIGLALPGQRAIFNVAIRTLTLRQKKATYNVGGGITWMSDWQDEYAETQAKAAVLQRQTPPFELITTARVENGQVTLLAAHLERFRQASRYFAFPYDEAALKRLLADLLADCDANVTYRLRLALDKAGHWTSQLAPLSALSEDFCQPILRCQTADLHTPFAHFKTSHRPHLDWGDQEIIYHLPDGRLLETSIGNLILEKDGQRFTPPADLGILSGIYRQELLAKGQLTEKVLTLDDLAEADAVYACNALRGLYRLDKPQKRD